MPHNNMPQEHAFGAETQFVRPTPTAAGGPVMLDHFHGHMVPIEMALQGPSMIHRRQGSSGSAGAIYTVYVPAHPHHHNVHPTATMPVHMVPASTYYDDHSSYARSHAHSSDEETAATTKHGNRSAAASFDSQHEAAHSELLLANSAIKQEKRKATRSPDNDMKVPFKKRKMISEILRAKEGSSFHVSPVSHGSKTSGIAAQSPDRSIGSHGSSFEELGGQPLPDSAKITENGAFALPKTVSVPHFPSQLFDLLANNESALQWCSDGKAWRIVRWDALRKNVLPKHFGGASVDAFLSEISAWGFTEISSGNDAGAYSHTLFRRGFPNLCKEIQRLDRGMGNPARATPSILQVPSLGDAAANTGSSEEEIKYFATGKAEDSRQQAVSPKNSLTDMPSTSAWSVHHPTQSHMYLPYQQQEENQKIEFQQYAHPQATAWVSAVPQDPSSAVSAYSPVLVRSGRGASRVPVRLPAQVTPNPTRGPAPEGRPNNNNIRVVSNRGRRTSASMVPTSVFSSYAPSPTSMPVESNPLRSALKPATRKGSLELARPSSVHSVPSSTSPAPKPPSQSP